MSFLVLVSNKLLILNIVLGVLLVVSIIVCFIIFSNLKKLKESSLKLEKAYFYDNVTGLPNEKYIIENWESSNRTFYLLEPQRKEQLSRVFGQKFLDTTMAMIAVNLKKLSSRYNLELYKFKEVGILIISNSLDSNQTIEKYVKEINNLFDQEVKVQNEYFNLKFWISIYNGNEVESILSMGLKLEAGLAMHKRTCEKNNLFFNIEEKSYSEYLELINLEKELYTLDFEECISPYYQLKYDITTNEIVGCEALARIIHPTRGVMNPDAFIPFYEDIGQIHRVDVAIFRKVCTDIAFMFNKKILPENFRVSVNFSTYTIENIDILSEFSNMIEKTGLKYNCLELELTETLQAENIELISKRLKELSKLGVLISLDDFFAGNSNFEKISMLPVNNLKLDKAFLEEKMTGKNAELIKSIKTFCENNKLSLIVEGVETKEHIDFLKSVGINLVQGYYYSRPLSKESLENLLSEKFEEL